MTDRAQALTLQAEATYWELERQASEAMEVFQKQADEAQELIERAGLWKPE